MTKTYVGQVGLSLLSDVVGPRCLRVPPPEPVVGLELWEMMLCPVRRSLDEVVMEFRSRIPADFKPQLYEGPWSFGPFGSYAIPGIYGKAALCRSPRGT